jgi:mannitol/fructose-specific phosphotransferase system IIA component (Ntr-type)
MLMRVVEGAVFCASPIATDRNSAIREMVHAVLAPQGYVPTDIESIAKLAIARENQGSCAFGKGAAVPHVKAELIRRISVGWFRFPRGIDFAALDRAPVYIVACLLSPAHDPHEHLDFMEKVFRLLQKKEVREALKRAGTDDEMRRVLTDASGGSE